MLIKFAHTLACRNRVVNLASYHKSNMKLPAIYPLYTNVFRARTNQEFWRVSCPWFSYIFSSVAAFLAKFFVWSTKALNKKRKNGAIIPSLRNLPNAFEQKEQPERTLQIVVGWCKAIAGSQVTFIL